MQSDLRDVYHGVHITGFHPIEIKDGGENFQGVMNDFYVQVGMISIKNHLATIQKIYNYNVVIENNLVTIKYAVDRKIGRSSYIYL